MIQIKTVIIKEATRKLTLTASSIFQLFFIFFLRIKWTIRKQKNNWNHYTICNDSNLVKTPYVNVTLKKQVKRVFRPRTVRDSIVKWLISFLKNFIGAQLLKRNFFLFSYNLVCINLVCTEYTHWQTELCLGFKLLLVAWCYLCVALPWTVTFQTSHFRDRFSVDYLFLTYDIFNLILCTKPPISKSTSKFS